MNAVRALVFVPGRGHRHAVFHLSLWAGLRHHAPEVDVAFASYAAGAETFALSSRPAHALPLNEHSNFAAALFQSHDLIRRLSPCVVIAHDEPAAVAAARLANVRCLYIAAALPPPATMAATAISEASSIIVLNEPGVFPVPGPLKAAPRFVGRQPRPLRHTCVGRASLRAELEIADSDHVITVIPGGSTSEEKAPMADTVLAAFRRLPLPRKKLYWVSARDNGYIREKARSYEGVTVLPFDPCVERYIAASDVVVAKGLGTVVDAASAGVPSVSLSPQPNLVDDHWLLGIPSNLALQLRAVNADILCQHLVRILASAAGRARGEPAQGGAAGGLAEIIARELQRLTRVSAAEGPPPPAPVSSSGGAPSAIEGSAREAEASSLAPAKEWE